MENKICQNCKQDFSIDSEDFLLYQKLGVPAPTFCFQCRLQRRMMFRNERAFYKRKNNAPGKEQQDIVSIHRPETVHTIYDDRTWWSDSWSPMDFGKEYNFSKPFFVQFKELYQTVPLINLSITNMVNCSFCNVSEGDKGSYMITASNRNEDCFYGNRLSVNKQSGDMYIASYNELSYEIVNFSKNYRVFYSTNTHESADSYFLYNCKNCTDCIGCVNLRGKSNCIFNVQYSKEEYKKIKEEFNLHSTSGINAIRSKFDEFVKNSIHKFSHSVKTVDSSGDNLENTSNVKNSFDINEAQDSRNLTWGGFGLRDSMDAGPGVGIQSDLLYDCFDTALQASMCLWTIVVYHSFDVRYSINCHSCEHVFGCHGLRNKKYCILNKQYTKEEYEVLIPKIIEHMNTTPYIDAKGRIFTYGEFFPYEISPFAYNETVAQEYFPLEKNEILQNGWTWYDRADRHYAITMSEDVIPDTIARANENIFNEIIECRNQGLEKAGCTTAFRVTKEECEFYKKLDVPIPHYCPNCRHYNRLLLRNPLKLWHRTCMCEKSGHNHEERCKNEFETSYAPNRPEMIYCEGCYQKEVI